MKKTTARKRKSPTVRVVKVTFRAPLEDIIAKLLALAEPSTDPKTAKAPKKGRARL